MFGELNTLAYGIITFGIVIGVGTLILYNFSGAVANCPSTASWNATSGACSYPNGTSISATGTAYTNSNYFTTQFGSSGLAGWTPAIIAISVGLLFLGAFMGKGKNKGRY